MKVPLLITQYLLQNKTLALQGLGSFTFDNDFDDSNDNDKEEQKIPENSIAFNANIKVKEDDGLIVFISKQSGKIKPLASADLDSFLELGKQMLNIGKPFIIEGLGFLQKHPANSQLEFTQGSIVIQKKDDTPAKRNRRKDIQDDNGVYEENFLKKPRKANGSRKVLFGFLVVAGLSLIGWVGYFFYNQSVLQDEPVQKQEVLTNIVNPVTDSTNTRQDTVHQNTSIVPAVPEKKEGFNIVLEISSKNRAYNRMAKLKYLGHNVIMTTTDSVKFKLALPINAPLSDTARHRDSLSRFFARKVWIETN